MIYYVDNFLPQDEFEALATRVRKGFRGDTSSLVENSDEPLRVTHHDHSGDWEEGCNFIGQECRPAIKKMIATMKDLGIKDLKNWSKIGRASATSLKNLTHTIAPKPNRMLIWSRDEWHAVQKVTNSDPNYIRSFFASGWSSIDVQQAKGEFYDLQ